MYLSHLFKKVYEIHKFLSISYYEIARFQNTEQFLKICNICSNKRYYKSQNNSNKPLINIYIKAL